MRESSADSRCALLSSAVFQKQNKKIDRGEISGPGTHYLHLDTLGIINGCIEDEVQAEGYSVMSWNNTYGLEAINETMRHWQLYELERAGGVKDQLRECGRLARALETPGRAGVDPSYVERYCLNATETTAQVLIGPYMETKKYGWFDVTHPSADSFPLNYHLGWLNQRWVQKALGVPVNFTWASSSVGMGFSNHGDMPRGGYLSDLAHLLDNGVKVHLVYGDRDFACNW